MALALHCTITPLFNYRNSKTGKLALARENARQKKRSRSIKPLFSKYEMHRPGMEESQGEAMLTKTKHAIMIKHAITIRVRPHLVPEPSDPLQAQGAVRCVEMKRSGRRRRRRRRRNEAPNA